MIKTYKIGDIILGLSYKYDEYFKNNIETYQVDQPYNHLIESNVVDFIPLISGEPTVSHKNRYIYSYESHEVMTVLNNEKQIEIKIEYDYEYKHIHLYFLESLENIAEKEYIFTGIMFMDLAIFNGYLSIHAAALKINDKALVFSAPSKTGKSTHAKYWLASDENISIINDDKPLVKIDKDIFVYGSPWSGKTTQNTNERVKLDTIIFLGQGSNRIYQLSRKEKMLHLMKNINRPRHNVLWDNTLSVINSIVDKIPMYFANVENNETSVAFVKDYIWRNRNED